ncbi:MAG: glycerol-3-phosphate acyltransferase [Clostridiales bacterium]|nr:glycerol-3-phosphate acyltransferase [Clostridiales bacterium]
MNDNENNLTLTGFFLALSFVATIVLGIFFGGFYLNGRVILGLLIGVAAWFLALFLFCIIQAKIRTSYQKRTGFVSLTKKEKEEVLQKFENDYNNQKIEALKTAEERYKINFDIINLGLSLTEAMIESDIQRGIEMQTTDAPGADWAIAGGLASGLAGGLAGAGAALDTMRKNAEATERQHELGRKITKNALESYQTHKKISKDLTPNNFDEFIYTETEPKLINKLNAELKFTNNFYGVGYVEASIKISSKRNYTFPNTKKKAVIDGSVRVDLYDKDGIKLIASGYYCPPGRFGNDRTKTGFGLDEYEIIILKEEPGMSVKPGNSSSEDTGYQIKLSNPNLWLLRL